MKIFRYLRSWVNILVSPPLTVTWLITVRVLCTQVNSSWFFGERGPITKKKIEGEPIDTYFVFKLRDLFEVFWTSVIMKN